MKQELYINIILGIVAIGIIGFILTGSTPQTAPPATTQQNAAVIPVSAFTLHNSTSDCWIRINGSVYNITGYLSAHPGGVEIVLPFCGGPDATEAFATKGGRGSHSNRAEQLLQTLFIGTLAT